MPSQLRKRLLVPTLVNDPRVSSKRLLRCVASPDSLSRPRLLTSPSSVPFSLGKDTTYWSYTKFLHELCQPLAQSSPYQPLLLDSKPSLETVTTPRADRVVLLPLYPLIHPTLQKVSSATTPPPLLATPVHPPARVRPFELSYCTSLALATHLAHYCLSYRPERVIDRFDLGPLTADTFIMKRSDL